MFRVRHVEKQYWLRIEAAGRDGDSCSQGISVDDADGRGEEVRTAVLVEGVEVAGAVERAGWLGGGEGGEEGGEEGFRFGGGEGEDGGAPWGGGLEGGGVGEGAG